MPSFDQIYATIPFLTGLAGCLMTLILIPPFIALQCKLGIGQFIRAEGPASHNAKASTPTMGGVCFLLSTCIISLIFLTAQDRLTIDSIIVLVIGTACGILGFFDDLAKYRTNSNAGVSAWTRLLLELLLGLTFAICLLNCDGPDGAFRQWVCASHGRPEAIYAVLPAGFYLSLFSFYVAATCNAVNLHDGLDGLAAGTSWQVLLCLSLMLLWTRQTPLALIAAAAAGSVLAFLVFNRYPARIFMGDVGSLFIGGLMACLAIAGHLALWFIPLASIFILETVSVIVQVLVFKLTKPYTSEKPLGALTELLFKLTHRLPGQGKRVFRMAPLHHHFEALSSENNISEGTIVTAFWLVQLVICVSVLAAFHWKLFS